MALSLDHIVIAVHDLDRTAEDYRKLGFTVLEGGTHADGASHNVLVVLEDGAYLELIAFLRPRTDNRWSEVLARAGEGLVDHALLPTDTAAVVEAARMRGLDIVGPTPGGRLRPDGERLEWQTARSSRPDVPFLCGDVTPRRLRVPEGDVRKQPNGVVGISGLTVAVMDVEASSRRYAALLGVEPPVSEVQEGMSARTAKFTLADSAVTLASPLGATGPMAEHLAVRGEGPYAVAFRGPRDVGELDLATAHGARLSIVAG